MPETPTPDGGPGDVPPSPADVARALWAQVSEIKTALAVGAALLYLIIRGVYVGFYDTLGVDPAEVGHGRTDILEAAALGLGLWLLVAAAATTLLTAVTVARATTPVALSDRRVVRAGFSWSLIVLALTPLVAASASAEFVADAWNVATLCLCVGLLVAAVALSRSERFRLGAALAGTLLLLLTVVIAHRWGMYEATRALRGDRVNPGTFGLIDIRVEPVCLLTDSHEPNLIAFTHQPQVRYLGNHQPYSLLLLPGVDARILRVPSSVYTTVSTTKPC